MRNKLVRIQRIYYGKPSKRQAYTLASLVLDTLIQKRMSFLQNYILYNSGNEIPRNYNVWSALAVLSAAVGRKVYTDYSYDRFHCGLYVTLVGEAGNRKSSARSTARNLCREELKNVPLGPSTTTKEEIAKFMASDDCLRVYTDENKALVEYRPYTIFINELKNFMNVNPAGMIDFLTDIYDEKVYESRTKNMGCDLIVNPYLVILACETPEWIVARFKQHILSGGFARRMVFVYETEEARRIAFPEIPPEGKVAWGKVREHIRLVAKEPVGPFAWTPEAKDFYRKWYEPKVQQDDPIMRGYYRSKHVQLIKVSMLMALSVYPFRLEHTVETLQAGLALLDVTETNMAKLFQGIGRNELSLPMSKMLELLEAHRGIMPEKDFMRFAGRDMSPPEVTQVINHLIQTEQIVKGKATYKRPDGSPLERIIIMTKKYFEEKGKK